MINWTAVYSSLKPLCTRDVSGIDDLLYHLYIEKNMSLQQITNETNREIISSRTLRNRLHKLGITIKNRGGANNNKDVPVTLIEIETVPASLLAREYDCDVSTIYNRRKKLEKLEKLEKIRGGERK